MVVAKRLWELDFLRGIAIVLMIIFHVGVDLSDFYGYSFNYLSGFWYYEGMLTAVLFLFLAGVSTVFSKRCLQHGLQILGWGMVVTLVTYWYNPYAYVRFGILHLIGSGLIFNHLIRNTTGWSKLAWALLLLAGGEVVGSLTLDQSWLLPLGIVPAGFTTLDYYPFLPWGGVIILGSWVGSRIYMVPRSILKEEPKPNFLTYIGRRSLWIYLLHQPVILAVLWVVLE